jgi:hypothetical protein
VKRAMMWRCVVENENAEGVVVISDAFSFLQA